MTIRRGEDWGDSVARPDRLMVASSDHQLAEFVSAHPDQPVGLSGGDLFRTIGAPAGGDTATRLPIDVLHVVADGTPYVAVAHVIARRSWWRGPIIAIMNVDHVGVWNVAPRAHPNDGRFDTIEVTSAMTLRQRLQARARMRQGTHLPHPCIQARTGTESTWHFERPQRLWVDGVIVGSVRELSVTVESDGCAIHV